MHTHRAIGIFSFSLYTILVVVSLLMPLANNLQAEVATTNGRWRDDIIVDPAISRRCHRLKGHRKDKKLVIQRLAALIVRNHKAMQSTVITEVTAKSILRTNRQKLFEEYHLSKMKLQNIDRKIVRSGCPNIEL